MGYGLLIRVNVYELRRNLVQTKQRMLRCANIASVCSLTLLYVIKLYADCH